MKKYLLNRWDKIVGIVFIVLSFIICLDKELWGFALPLMAAGLAILNGDDDYEM